MQHRPTTTIAITTNNNCISLRQSLNFIYKNRKEEEEEEEKTQSEYEYAFDVKTSTTDGLGTAEP